MNKEEKRAEALADKEAAQDESDLIELQHRATAMKQLHESGGVQMPELDPRPFLALLSRKEDLRKVVDKLEEVLWTSFAMDIRLKMGGRPSGAEISRRFKICEDWFRHARGDLGYSLEQTLDLMNHALRASLDGLPFDPLNPGRRIWTPT